jgi:hypothetical protein
MTAFYDLRENESEEEEAEICAELEKEIVQLAKEEKFTEVKLEGAELEAYIAKRFPK